MPPVFCDCGTAWITQLMMATITSTTYFIGWGTGAGTAAKADTTLFSELGSRQAASDSISAFNQCQWTATQTATAIASITNAALFNNNSGTMLIKGDFATIALQANDRIQFTITLTST
jgi:hypothetical protein